MPEYERSTGELKVTNPIRLPTLTIPISMTCCRHSLMIDWCFQFSMFQLLASGVAKPGPHEHWPGHQLNWPWHQNWQNHVINKIIVYLRFPTSN